MIETGKRIPEVAEELGVRPGTLQSWVSLATQRFAVLRPSGTGGGGERPAARE
ncbi:hypothetical protein AB0G85_35790 [Streptomyces sioyaensis]|uniref:hypothetical protein n=1 Tax=Streptomyces sioyaensis TaxID=67364 RepID=UPI0033EBDADD